MGCCLKKKQHNKNLLWNVVTCFLGAKVKHLCCSPREALLKELYVLLAIAGRFWKSVKQTPLGKLWLISVTFKAREKKSQRLNVIVLPSVDLQGASAPALPQLRHKAVWALAGCSFPALRIRRGTTAGQGLWATAALRQSIAAGLTAALYLLLPPAKAPVTVTYPNPENILKQGQLIVINNLTACKCSKDLVSIYLKARPNF